MFGYTCHRITRFGLKVHTLVYPPTTVYQMIGSISIPISGLPMNHKVFFDWGFQMNYQMPFNLSEFYMVPIWSTGASNVQKRHLHYQTDFTVRELYEGLKDLLERSCLGRSICELARRPFDDNYKNILTDILTFLLTSSENSGLTAIEDEAGCNTPTDLIIKNLIYMRII
ncbi:hypothetical protein GQX74_000235 [Glossina fuscipes]|nr:hypothetical protein GQX74_000235 [Glossina fuscipes]